LQQKNSPLGGATPNQLAAFSLAILDVNVSARILQATMLELTINEDAVIEDDVLIFKRLVLSSIHGRTSCGFAEAPGLAKARPIEKLSSPKRFDLSTGLETYRSRHIVWLQGSPA
jgi:hypothetical protein